MLIINFYFAFTAAAFLTGAFRAGALNLSPPISPTGSNLPGGSLCIGTSPGKPKIGPSLIGTSPGKPKIGPSLIGPSKTGPSKTGPSWDPGPSKTGPELTPLWSITNSLTAISSAF